MAPQNALKTLLREHGITLAELAPACGLSRTALSLLVNHDHWPSLRSRAEVAGAINQALAKWRLAVDFNQEKVAAACGNGDSITPPPIATPLDKGITGVDMLIRKQGLSFEARRFFDLPGEPFAPPESKAQVFMGKALRVAYEHMLLKARHGGFIAIVGESGSGKTTLKETLIEELAEGGQVVVMEPAVVGMEQKGRGTALNAAHIAEAMLREIAPLQAPKRSAEARLNQLRDALTEARQQDPNSRHLLVIEEAHRMPLPTLRYMKNFMELHPKNSRTRLLSVVLIGQPELATLLSSADMSVREVWQRCEMAHLHPLGRQLGDYLKHRLGRAANAFAADAIDALGVLLAAPDGRSYAYPLAVDNWAEAALNVAAGIGAKSITGETIAETKRFLTEQRKAGR
jgi:type II secretory pathway predicted ATPase ExeA